MNTPLDHEPEDLRYAEYVLGVLDADARAAVEREIATEPRAAQEVANWQQYLLPLVEDIDPATPPGAVWARIRSELGSDVPHDHHVETPRGGWWESLALWRGLAFGAGAVAVACIIALIVWSRVGIAPTPPVPYMASTLAQGNGAVGWTATMDLRNARMIVVPAKPPTLPAARAPELWLIPAGQKPIAIGMIAINGPTTIQLDKALLARLGPTAALAVSVEPPGGSPTGQPTGPVIAKGAIGAVTAHASGKPVAMLWQESTTRSRQST